MGIDSGHTLDCGKDRVSQSHLVRISSVLPSCLKFLSKFFADSGFFSTLRILFTDEVTIQFWDSALKHLSKCLTSHLKSGQ